MTERARYRDPYFILCHRQRAAVINWWW